MNNQHRFSCIIARAAMLTLSIFVGCHKGDDTAKDDARRAELAQQLKALYGSYLTGNAARAKDSMVESVQLLEKTKVLPANDTAYALCLGYSRLVAIENTIDDRDLVSAYFLQARYWRLKELESSGKSTKQAMKAIDSFTIETCLALVDYYDKTNNSGKSPLYFRH